MEESKRPSLNPLSVPWGKKPRVEPTEPKDPVPSFIGVRNEAVRDSAGADHYISIVVRGLKGVVDGEYKLAWQEGNTLKQYLSQMKLVGPAMRAAVRDLTNPEKGRLRMHYIPDKGAKIVLGHPSVSSALEFQRSNHNAESIAARMGGGARVVEVTLKK